MKNPSPPKQIVTGLLAGIAAAVAAFTLLAANPFAPASFMDAPLVAAHADPGTTAAQPEH